MRRSVRSLCSVAAVGGVAALVAACGGSSDPVTTTVTQTHTVTRTVTRTVTNTVTVRRRPAPSSSGSSSSGSSSSGSSSSGSSSSAGGPVTSAQARQIALNHIGEGHVTDIGHEDDFGARWEVEITRPNGSEVDVYVSASGQVVHTVSRAAGSDD